MWGWGRRKDQLKPEAEIRKLCSKAQLGPSLLGRECAGQDTDGHELKYHRALSREFRSQGNKNEVVEDYGGAFPM